MDHILTGHCSQQWKSLLSGNVDQKDDKELKEKEWSCCEIMVFVVAIINIKECTQQELHFLDTAEENMNRTIYREWSEVELYVFVILERWYFDYVVGTEHCPNGLF